MSLREKLAAMAEQSKSMIPQEARAVMEASIEELRTSGILDHARKVGDMAPAFDLPSTSGEAFELERACTRGPVVVSYWRGKW